MKIKSKYESVLTLEKIEVVESSFRKKDVVLDSLELGVQFEHDLFEIDKDKYEVILSATISDENERIYVQAKTRAVFSIDGEDMNRLEKNAVAIMFPYLRSYISTITTQPGMTPIVLPALNIVAMIDEQRRECSVSQ